MRKLFAALLLFPALTLAQTVNQGRPGSFGPWPVTLASGSVTITVVITPSPGQGSQTEVLVLASGSTQFPASSLTDRTGIEIQNLGPNNIFCTLGAVAVLNKARLVSPNTAWSVNAGSNIRPRCIAVTADQVTGAATIFSEVK